MPRNRPVIGISCYVEKVDRAPWVQQWSPMQMWQSARPRSVQPPLARLAPLRVKPPARVAVLRRSKAH